MKYRNSVFSSLQSRLAKQETSCLQITRGYLDQIDKGAPMNAFIAVQAEQALHQAKLVDEKIRQNKAGRLAGMVVAVKDNLAVLGEPATCGSRMLKNFVPPYQATVIDRLLAEDAVIIGKTNMDEYAMGSSTENSAFGPVRNPHDFTRVAGGSSGGSAAAVAAGMCTTALGSDTGGSIRQPAAFCGVVGLKPTYGRVSRYGLIAYASSLDQIGPFSQDVYDCALLLEVIAGKDRKDATSSETAVPAFHAAVGQPVKGLRIGIPREYAGDGLQPEIAQALRLAAERLTDSGAKVCSVSLPHSEYAIAAYYVIATAEASSNLARYDGAHYGFAANQRSNLEEMYVNTRNLGFGSEVKRRIMLGTYVLSSGYYDAYYRKALQARTVIKADFITALEQVDCLLTPTTPTTAFNLGEKIDDPLTMYLSDVFTVSVNLAGLPAISFPFGRDQNNLPIGLQMIGRPFDESTILRTAGFLSDP